jgi:hypothetical protein
LSKPISTKADLASGDADEREEAVAELWSRVLAMLHIEPKASVSVAQIVERFGLAEGAVVSPTEPDEGSSKKISSPDSDSDSVHLDLNRFELATLESVLHDWIESRPHLLELEERRRIDAEARKLAQSGKLRDAARRMGWVAPKGRRDPVYDRDDVARGYWLLTTRSSQKVRQYLVREHGLTTDQAAERIPKAPLHPGDALEWLTDFYGFPTTQAMRKFLQRAKRRN